MLDSSCGVITRADMDIITDNEALVDALLLENPTEGMDGNLGEIKVTIHRAVHIIREKIRKENWDSESSDDSEDDDDSDSDDDRENETDNRKKLLGSHAETVREIHMVHESSMKATATIPHQVKCVIHHRCTLFRV